LGSRSSQLTELEAGALLWFGTELLHRGFPVIVRDYPGDRLVTILTKDSSPSLGTLAGHWTRFRRV